MSQAALIFAAALAGFAAGHAGLGYETTYRLGYGAITAMAAMIGATFLWLWRARTTPLALGMAFSWGGTASVMGWWWLVHLAGWPDWMRDSGLLFAGLALSVTGAGLHFAVIRRSFGLPGWSVPAAVAGALALSALTLTMF